MPNFCLYNRRGELIREVDTDSHGMEGTITIGRSSQCTICLKGEVDRHVGRIHLSLQREGKLWTVTNCSSTELYRNEQPVTTSRVDEGDIIRFGHTFLAFGSKAGPSPYELVYVDEDGKQDRNALWPGRNTIGSSSDNTICIKEMGLSRSHSRILVNQHDMLVEDVASTTGTLLDEKRVKSLTSFSCGSVLRLGKANCQVLQRGAALDRKKCQVEVTPQGPSLAKWFVGVGLILGAMLLARWLRWF